MGSHECLSSTGYTAAAAFHRPADASSALHSASAAAVGAAVEASPRGGERSPPSSQRLTAQAPHSNRPQTLTLNHPNNNGDKGLEEEARVKGWGLLSDCRYSDS